MAQATVKLFASLADYLPPGAKENATVVTLPPDGDGVTIGETLAQLKVPPERCHLVLVNGSFVAPSQRDSARIQDGDTLSVWPPVAGG